MAQGGRWSDQCSENSIARRLSLEEDGSAFSDVDHRVPVDETYCIRMARMCSEESDMSKLTESPCALSCDTSKLYPMSRESDDYHWDGINVAVQTERSFTMQMEGSAFEVERQGTRKQNRAGSVYTDLARNTGQMFALGELCDYKAGNRPQVLCTHTPVSDNSQPRAHQERAVVKRTPGDDAYVNAAFDIGRLYGSNDLWNYTAQTLRAHTNDTCDLPEPSTLVGL